MVLWYKRKTWQEKSRYVTSNAEFMHCLIQELTKLLNGDLNEREISDLL